MPDYAGAVAAIKSRLVSQWVDGSSNPTTLIVYVNKQPDPPFPPIDPLTNNPQPFLVCEVTGTTSAPYTFGNVGNRFFVYDGLILLHVLVPMDEGDARAQQLAVSAGEIFRAATFYVDANGSYVRTMAPNPPDGGSAANIEGVQAGNTFRVTVTIPFEFYLRASRPIRSNAIVLSVKFRSLCCHAGSVWNWRSRDWRRRNHDPSNGRYAW